jgi:hypothetical protein
LAACSSETASDDAVGDESNVTESATLAFGSDFKTKLTGTPRAGGALVVDYALDRLPQCRGNVGGGGPGWDISGSYSLNGGPAKSFEVTKLSDDGKDRVSKPARITLSEGGDLAVWFQVSNRWGCNEYDSQFGQNFHVDVTGTPPEADGSIVFKKDGSVDQQGKLHAGGKVKIRYEQDRLPQCRRVQGGMPQWSIGGNAILAGGKAQSFATGRPEGSDRVPIDAVLDLPTPGELQLWFEVSDVGGCHEVDSKGGQNYRFNVE